MGGCCVNGDSASAECPGDSAALQANGRVSISGKLFGVGARKWYLKGLIYGPFAPNSQGLPLPERPRLLRDLAHIRDLGGNCIRLYFPPPLSLLDDALEHGLRVMIDVPWEKHRCFFEDWSSQRDALERVSKTAHDLGSHPAVFAISVANELPHDVVRFYGARRVEAFIDLLLDCAKQKAPQCLMTYSNYPSTEFLNPARIDFYCANIYLHDPVALDRYLDRLHHVAEEKPLVLGEHGIDSIREGADAQARMVQEQIDCLFAKGAAGSFVFSYTDDWFTGGQQIREWAFGITTADRLEKQSAAVLRSAWAAAPKLLGELAPKVSVVVCSYNGASTLEQCLLSLSQSEYSNYEVILVDDGSTDQTPQIAAKFPPVKYIRQQNLGLSVARNVGAAAATGEIVAYTDSDCIADPTWLNYLVHNMIEQKADAIGGPNITPQSDRWVARCVSASPGNPCHVMIDDRRAEHVPGCNMAFRREALLKLGGFDPQFRTAGDDVDICWRFLDAGMTIGYAPAALVWHHRRNTVGAYLRQQKGYGRAEAMVQFKHPHRVNSLGAFRWSGVIYGDGGPRRGHGREAVFHGRFGCGPFQIIYRQSHYNAWSCFTMLEWHLLAAFITSLAFAFWPLFAFSAAMWVLSLASAVRSAVRAPLEKGGPLWCRLLIFLLHLAQPVIRSWHRIKYRVAGRRSRPQLPPEKTSNLKKLSACRFDLYWQSRHGVGRGELLHALAERAAAEGWRGDYQAEWHPHDIELIGDLWHDVRIRTATEELGGPHRFTRARCTLHLTWASYIAAPASMLWAAAASLTGNPWALGFTSTLLIVTISAVRMSRVRVRNAVAGLLARAGADSGLDPFVTGNPLPMQMKDQRKPSLSEPEDLPALVSD
ncbi:MAG TPA: glycosyltransferase [Tepidisphaeraceae bacterium]|nr:glycosyltransferase [Tepidisphaeraceae bacterium]